MGKKQKKPVNPITNRNYLVQELLKGGWILKHVKADGEANLSITMRLGA